MRYLAWFALPLCAALLTACLLPSGSGQSAIMLSTDIFADDGQQWALSKGFIVLIAVTLAIVLAGIISILVL